MQFYGSGHIGFGCKQGARLAAQIFNRQVSGGEPPGGRHLLNPSIADNKFLCCRPGISRWLGRACAGALDFQADVEDLAARWSNVYYAAPFVAVFIAEFP